MLLPVVLAGGVGSRLWPMSRALLPKQFIQFPQYEHSLFQNTVRRLEGIANISDPLVLCNADHRFLVAEQLRVLEKTESRIVLEPVGRNTAPAVAIAAFLAVKNSPDAILLVLPSDHVIENVQRFEAAVESAMALAQKDYLVTFGIVPGAPETGYGYIERGEKIEEAEEFRVAQFVEKPDKATAESYIESGKFFWNSGMFMFSAKRYLEEIRQHAPDIFAACESADQKMSFGDDFQSIPESEFTQCPSDSIDYAVMEHTDKAAMVPLDAGWNDLGAWEALWDIGSKDDQGNVLSGDVLTENVSGSYIQSQSRLIAAVGIKDAVIVETPDAVLVSNKQQAQAVKAIVEQVVALNREEGTSHRKVVRPWGSYESLSSGDGYQVKHIVVNPGEALSLQMHYHRAEHWTVIKGKAVVTCDDSEFNLEVNESTFIPQGSKHRLANPSTESVEIIEVQVGDYLGEDDIVRFEDKYGRTENN